MEVDMDINIADILFHIPANLETQERNHIEQDLQGCDGVISAHFVPERPHMLEVAYDPMTITTSTLREHLNERGLKVSMAGL
jgi:hypothetical protein